MEFNVYFDQFENINVNDYWETLLTRIGNHLAPARYSHDETVQWWVGKHDMCVGGRMVFAAGEGLKKITFNNINLIVKMRMKIR